MAMQTWRSRRGACVVSCETAYCWSLALDSGIQSLSTLGNRDILRFACLGGGGGDSGPVGRGRGISTMQVSLVRPWASLTLRWGSPL